LLRGMFFCWWIMLLNATVRWSACFRNEFDRLIGWISCARNNIEWRLGFQQNPQRQLFLRLLWPHLVRNRLKIHLNPHCCRKMYR
jgi:hypothetical protein